MSFRLRWVSAFAALCAGLVAQPGLAKPPMAKPASIASHVPAKVAPSAKKGSAGTARTLRASPARAKSKPHAKGSNPYLEIPEVAVATDAPAYLYANLSDEQAIAELTRRGVPFRQESGPTPGVRAPIRLTGKLRGVHIHSVLPEAEWATTPFEVLDARLALALDDFCRILAHHDVVEVIHFTMYRPAGPRAADHPQSRHPAGLAIDLGAMRKREGGWLAVGPHWSDSIGSKTCGQGARRLIPRRGREIASIVCEAADQRIFHYMLTPHFDAAHADHLHLEIKPGVKWFIVN